MFLLPEGLWEVYLLEYTPTSHVMSKSVTFIPLAKYLWNVCQIQPILDRASTLHTAHNTQIQNAGIGMVRHCLTVRMLQGVFMLWTSTLGP